MGDRATFHSGSPKQFATTFQGFQIQARKDLADDKVELKYWFGFENGLNQTKVVTMVKTNGVWLGARTRLHDASWDAGSQPGPES